MIKRIYILASLLLLSVTTFAREKDVKFTWDVDFEMNFDNREFYESAFTNSMIIFGARLTPAFGLEYLGKDGAGHRLMAGIDVMKDFGASPVSELLAGGKTDETLPRQNNLNMFREITIYYNLEKKIGDTGLELYAGIFPRRKMEGRYSEAFFSDSLKFYDNNLEGLLVKIHRPKAYFEVGCDWFGQYGQARRERFMVYSSGESRIAPFFSIGYSGYMYHFANCAQVQGLVDNILIEPYARFDFSDRVPLQTLELTFGWLQAFQHNREHVGHYVFPGGGHLDLEARKWNIAVKNMLFYGTDMMPYFNWKDEGGFKYGTNLYLGDPFYRIHDDGTKGAGVYDRLEVCYEPSIGEHVKIKVAALFHFHNFHYSGCQQIVGITASF